MQGRPDRDGEAEDKASPQRMAAPNNGTSQHHAIPKHDPDEEGETWDRSLSQRMAALTGTSQHRAIPKRPPGEEGEAWDKALSQRMAALTGTSQHRAIPQRPPGMARLGTAPSLPRVPRPQHEVPPPRKMRRLLIILGSLFAVAAIIACTVGVLLANGLQAGAGPAGTANDFFTALAGRNYEQAYKDLGPDITIPTQTKQFIQQAQALDTCYGPVTDYKSAGAVNNGDTQTYTFTMKRSKLAQSYQLHLTMRQYPDDTNAWKISNYGTSLGPTQSAPPCNK